MKLGIVDLDTSHPQNWIPILRELGADVVGVFDGGSVHPADYVRAFAKEHGIGTVFPSLEAMADAVDTAIIHGSDWDTHLTKARPFVERGRRVLIDKPLAGNADDLRRLVEWQADGALLTGGSSLRYCPEVADLLALPVEERGEIRTVFTGCGVDDFNYGIHAYSLLAGLMGPGAVSVRQLSQRDQRCIEVRYADGRTGLLLIGQTKEWLPFYTTVVTDRGVRLFEVAVPGLYERFLRVHYPFLAGQVDTPPMAMAELVEPERMALAARRSWLEGQREVALDEVAGPDGYDGAEFAEGYRRSKYPDA